MIAEALQDLPNISLNWDIRRPMLRDEPIKTVEVFSEHDALLLGEQETKRLLQCGVAPNALYIRYEGNAELPEGLREVQRLNGAFAPRDSRVIFVEGKRAKEPIADVLDPASLAELHMVTAKEAEAREAYDESCFLRHPSLVARFYAKAPF